MSSLPRLALHPDQAAGTTPPAPAPALELDGVSKVYPGTPPVVALAEASLRVESGELLAVVGPSGSGKSTMMNMMGSLDRPTAGVVSIEGIDTSTLDDDALTAIRGQRIGFVFQRFFLLPGVTTVDNVANGLLYAGVSRVERRRAATAALTDVGLGHRLDHLSNELSGGEIQRVAVARALVHDPAVLLADEPTGNLDSRSSAAVTGLLRELNERGRTIVIVTHDQAMADALPRQVHMLDGRIEADCRARP